MDKLKLLFVGDVMLGREVNRVLKYQPPSYPWGDTLQVFDSADLRICNLECAISADGEPWPEKEFHFRSDPENIAVLSTARIDAVTLANNHALDFGPQALADTIHFLDAAKIGLAGAGSNVAAAIEPAILRVGQHKVGLIAFTDDRPDWEAHADTPGIAYVPVDFQEERANRLFATIKKTRRELDMLIISAHWGPNRGERPPLRQPAFAHHLIDLGADIIFGHSGHIFRGVETYRHRPIIYCAGDFIDDYAVDETERNDETFIFVVETSALGISRLRLYPAVIQHCQVNLARGSRAAEIALRMTRLCCEMNTPTVWQEPQHLLEIPIAA
jgi:poly-gamma-glutamate capsule biosynthesis protein CapA/YwtB (metallophosphatase superfamily)